MVAAVLTVAVSFPPGLVEKWDCARIGCLDGVAKDHRFRDDVIVDVAGTKAAPLTLPLEHHHVPVPATDQVNTACGMTSKGLASRGGRTDGCTKACTLRQALNLRQCNWVIGSGLPIWESAFGICDCVFGNNLPLQEARRSHQCNCCLGRGSSCRLNCVFPRRRSGSRPL